MRAVILAAGYGTRMGLNGGPKHLLEIKQGVPIIELVVRAIADSRDVRDIHIITNGIFHDQFKRWLSRFKAEQPIILINNGTQNNEQRLGSIGDLLYCLDQMGGRGSIENSRGLLVAQGDDLVYNLKMGDFLIGYRRKGASLVLVHRMRAGDIAERFGAAETVDEKIIRVAEKPRLEDIKTDEDGTALAIGGTYVFARSDVSTLYRYRREGQDLDKIGNLLSWMVKEGTPLFAYEHPREHWWDIGKPEDLERAREFYRNV